MRRLIIAAAGAACLLVAEVSALGQWQNYHGPYLFGYLGVEAKAVNMSEVEANGIPTNVQTIPSGLAADSIGSKIDSANSRGQRAVILLDRLLFIVDQNLDTPCGPYSMRHRLDFKLKFDAWLQKNGEYMTPEKTALLLLHPEVNNACIPPESIDMVAQYVNSKNFGIPVIAAYSATVGAQPLPEVIPASLAGVGFYKYQVLDPTTDADFQRDYALMKSRMTPDQKIVLGVDGFYDSWYRALGWPRWYLGYVALNYSTLALNDPQVTGLLIFQWESFYEFGETKTGTRDLPQNVRDRHRQAACQLGVYNPFVPSCQ